VPGPRPEPLRDISAGRWLEERLWDWGPEGVRLGSNLPDGFAAYARILHPASRLREDGGGKLRWATIASWTGGTVHPDVQFDRLARLQPHHAQPSWGYRPYEGSLPREETERLVALLRPHTSMPDVCWFAVWEGFGFEELNRYYHAFPRIQVPYRAYFLFQGSLETVMTFVWGGHVWQSPNIWWPDDRAWCVATEIDLDSTYIGGSQACIDQIVADPEFEAFRTTIDARVDIGGDTMNPMRQ
jgi:hypothetical protein